MNIIDSANISIAIKGEKARVTILEDLKKSKMELIAMRSLLREVDAKLNPPVPPKTTKRIRLIAKSFLTNKIAHREEQLFEIKQILTQNIRSKIREQGPQQIKEITKSLRQLHPSYLSQEGVFRVAGNEEAMRGWMESDRNVDNLIQMDVHSIFTIIKRIMGESLAFQDGEFGELVKNDFPDTKEGYKKLRSLIYSVKPGMQDYFEFLHKINQYEAQNKMTTVNLTIAACQNLNFCVDTAKLGLPTSNERAFLEWLIKNPN